MARNPNRKWRKAMWTAINNAAGNGDASMWVRDVHPIWGLRAIRDFERINSLTFDPLNDLHTMHTFWMGRQLITLRYLETQAKHLCALADCFRQKIKITAARQ